MATYLVMLTVSVFPVFHIAWGAAILKGPGPVVSDAISVTCIPADARSSVELAMECDPQQDTCMGLLTGDPPHVNCLSVLLFCPIRERFNSNCLWRKSLVSTIVSYDSLHTRCTLLPVNQYQGKLPWIGGIKPLSLDLQYKSHLSRELNCLSLGCRGSSACWRCSNYIFIPDLIVQKPADVYITSRAQNVWVVRCANGSLEITQWRFLSLPLRAFGYISLLYADYWCQIPKYQKLCKIHLRTVYRWRPGDIWITFHVHQPNFVKMFCTPHRQRITSS